MRQYVCAEVSFNFNEAVLASYSILWQFSFDDIVGQAKERFWISDTKSCFIKLYGPLW